MVSRINPNVPPNGKAYTKDVRANFSIAYDEITELQARTSTGIDDVPFNPPGARWVRTTGVWVQEQQLPPTYDGGTF